MLKLHRSLHIFLLATVLMFPLFVFQTAAAADPDLFISEIMAENNGPLVDEDGDESDWLELHNRGTDPLDLSGYYLTDDPLELDKWAFPAVTLNAGEYLLVFASDKNRDVGELHTNFSLKTEGEYLALVEPDGLTVVYEFSPAYAPQQKGLSYGTPDGTAVLGYFQTPTPASANTTPYFEGIIGGVNFNYEHGFYDTPFNLVLDAIPADAVIRYTLDGSTPTESHGAIYTAALPITQTTFVRALAYKTNYITTPVNTQTYLFLDDVAVQFADGLPPTPAWPSLFVSNDNYRVTGKNQLFNYGMDPDIVIDGEGDSGLYTAAEIKEALASISSISLVTDLENLVDPATGIYVNAGQRGSAWERPVSMELMFPDGTEGFQINAGLRIRGGYSRSDNNPKHAFRLFFSSDYGESKLRYPFFGDEGADEFDNLDLRTSQNYSWSFNNSNKNTFLREIFARDLMRDMGQPYTRSRYHHLYINGVYWGLYMSEERPEASFGETYFGGDKTEYDVIKSAGSSGGYNTEATDGDLNGDWKDLWDLGRAQNANPTLERYMQMQGLNPDGTRNPAYPVLLDEDNLIDYMIQIFYTGAFDNALSWYLTYAGVRDKGSNNWYGVRNRVTDDMGFQFFAHDGEHSLGVQYSPGQDLADTRSNRVGPFHEADQQGIFSGSNPQYLHQDLMYTEEYAVAFGDRVHKYFFNDGILTPDAVYNRIEPRRQVVDAVIMAEAARWGDSKRVTPYDKSTWLNEVNRMYYYLLYDGGNPVRVNRTVEVLNQLIAVGLYPSVEAPTYNQHGGLVAPNFNLTMTTFPTGTVYYTLDGSDPRLLGGAINPEALVYNGGNVVLTNDVTVKARQWTGSEWSALNEADFIINNAVPADGTNLVISEIHYNPADEDDDWEFLEFKNIGAEKLDLAGVTVSGAVTFVFPELTLLQPGEHLLIVEDEIAFNSRYATNTLSPWYYDGLAVAGAWTGSLSNGGEEIIVTAADLSLILQFAYDDSGAWPSRADGYGSGVELTDPTAVPSTQPERNIYLADGNHWRPTSEYHGSPGRDGLGPDNRAVINEILANNGVISDTIELYNTTAAPLDISGWYVSDST
ncbi:MAG: lamin tail domain-containing protein, partial [Anaerolineales bacterium]|nr:lamin tail domain-containing protein [Anaerolineales bacterium]